MKKRIILASGSPRRRELLSQIGVEFEVIPARGEETITKQEPSEVVEELSAQKAWEVAAGLGEGIVIGADTVVACDGEIMGKPKDAGDAARMLSELQGHSHSVFTGVTVLVREAGRTAAAHTFHSETKVSVYPMTEREIREYIATGEPMDKAGAYAIQGRFAAYIRSVEGDYSTVVDLPVGALWQILKQYLSPDGGGLTRERALPPHRAHLPGTVPGAGR